ncbi:MAG: B12-binding domain-containing radical SAM protein [Flavobacteriales bacterium]|nr:B12-binding domain-containing radical SAM protein [Flavobacteriales bacterium]
MDILLTHGYCLADDPREQKIMKPYPPLGILYVSAYLKQQGFYVDVLDTTFSSFDAQKAYILEKMPPVIGLYANLMTKPRIVEIMKWIRNEPSLQGTRILVGGPDVTHNLEGYLGHGADAAVVGEGEETAAALLGAWRSNDTGWCSLPGIAWMKDGKVVRNPAREKVRNLDVLPYPDRESVDMQAYLNTWKHHHGHSAMSVSTQRGCPYTCKWCSTAVYGQSYRRRSPAHVADELAYLSERFAPDTFWFVDDVFTVSYRWLASLAEELSSRRLKVKFECITRADRMNEEVLGILKAMGCFRIWIGAESGSQDVIDAMDRRVDVLHVRDMIRAARRHGIEAGTFIMLGYPGETEADIRETVRHLKSSLPDQFTITVAYPIRGTSMHRELDGKVLASGDWATTTDRDLDFIRTYQRKYYDFAVRHVVNEVEWEKARKQGHALRPYAIKKRLASGAARLGMWYYKTYGK